MLCSIGAGDRHPYLLKLVLKNVILNYLVVLGETAVRLKSHALIVYTIVQYFSTATCFGTFLPPIGSSHTKFKICYDIID